MRFLNASVLERKALNRNLSWGFPLGNLLPKIGQRLREGKTYRVNLGGGGETYCRVCSPKPLLEASEIGVGLVGASFF